jgi:hypothetical protein
MPGLILRVLVVLPKSLQKVRVVVEEQNSSFSLVFEGCFRKSGVQDVVFCGEKCGGTHGKRGLENGRLLPSESTPRSSNFVWLNIKRRIRSPMRGKCPNSRARLKAADSSSSGLKYLLLRLLVLIASSDD